MVPRSKATEQEAEDEQYECDQTSQRRSFVHGDLPYGFRFVLPSIGTGTGQSLDNHRTITGQRGAGATQRLEHC